MLLSTEWEIEDFSQTDRIKEAKAQHNAAMLRLIEKLKSVGYDGFMVGDSVVKGDKFTYEGKLWSVLQDHTIMPHYYPSINTASLYVEVTEDYNEAGEELGTLENPIEYSGYMVLEEGKFYIQDEVTYRCTRNSINPVYHALKDLVGTFVETA